MSVPSIAARGLLPRGRPSGLSGHPYLMSAVQGWSTLERLELLERYIVLSLQPDTWAARKRDALVVIGGDLVHGLDDEQAAKSFWVRGADTAPDLDLTEGRRCTDASSLAE